MKRNEVHIDGQRPMRMLSIAIHNSTKLEKEKKNVSMSSG
jgi:hypothetical protein